MEIFDRFSSSACHQVPPPGDPPKDKRRPQAGSRTVLECPGVLGARLIIPKTILKKSKISGFQKFCFENFRSFAPPPPPAGARCENPPRFRAEMCFDRFFSVERRGFFSQGLFISPMSSFPVIFISRFGVKTLHPTRYRPPAMFTGHPEKRTTMWAALWEKRPMVATTTWRISSNKSPAHPPEGSHPRPEPPKGSRSRRFAVWA